MSETSFWFGVAKAVGLPGAILFAWWYHNREQNNLWGQMLDSWRAQTAEMMKLNGEQAKQTLDSYRSQATQMLDNSNKQAGQMLDNTNKIWSTMMDMIGRRLDQQNEVLKGLLDTIQYQGAQLARMEEKIDKNQQCPLIKKEQQK